MKTRQRHTAQRDLNIYTGEAGKKKCNLFLITQPHINPMQRRSKLSLIAPLPSTQKCGVSERRAVWGAGSISVTFCFQRGKHFWVMELRQIKEQRLNNTAPPPPDHYHPHLFSLSTQQTKRGSTRRKYEPWQIEKRETILHFRHLGSKTTTKLPKTWKPLLNFFSIWLFF